MAMQKSWEDARAEGRTEARADDVLMVLQVRDIPVPAAARRRILGQKDPKQLARWLKKAVVATSLAEVLGSSARGASAARGRADGS